RLCSNYCRPPAHTPSRSSFMTEPLSPAVQDYLKAIHALGGADRVALPNEIALALEVRAPSVTRLPKRPAQDGPNHPQSRDGARFTWARAGRGAARGPPAPAGRAVPDPRARARLERGGCGGGGARARHLPATGGGPGGTPGRAAGGPARAPDPDIDRRDAPARPEAPQRLPGRRSRRDPRGRRRQPGAAAALELPWADARGRSRNLELPGARRPVRRQCRRAGNSPGERGPVRPARRAGFGLTRSADLSRPIAFSRVDRPGGMV